MRGQRAVSSPVRFSAKIAAVSLIVCVCTSLVLILSLTRGHERARSRHIDQSRAADRQGTIDNDQGALSNFELRVTLLSAGAALSSFFIGFLFLGRIVFHL